MEYPIFYFDVNRAIVEQKLIIDLSGGLRGIREIGLLESVLEHIQNDLYYPDFVDKLTHLIFAVNKFHAFNDGNKRSSLYLGAYFMELNGYDYCIERFWHETENYVVSLAEGKIDKSVLREIMCAYLYEEEFSDALKLTLIEALGGFER